MNILRQSVGIDISEESFEARFGSLDDSFDKSISYSLNFKNNLSGFKKLLKWSNKQNRSGSVPITFAMEATGVYYEKLAHFLHKNNCQVAVILPNKIKNYAKSLGTKSKTDPIDAATIAMFALERKHKLYTRPDPFMASIKGLVREYHTLKEMITEIKNQIHAKKSAFSNDKSTLRRKRKLLTTLEKQTKEILEEISNLFKSKPSLDSKIKKIAKIKGVGEITIITIIAETNCFEHATNINQIVSYAGLDVVLKESGKKRGKETISKRGNKFIRKALFMPAMCTCRYNPKFREFYQRLLANGKNKKAAIIAVARKLLVLIYTLWKNDAEYIPDYDPMNKAAFGK